MLAASRAAPSSRGIHSQHFAFTQRLISPLLLLLAWELLCRTGVIPPQIIAAPTSIGATFWHMLASGELAQNLLISLLRVLKGMTISLTLGTALALIAGLSVRGELAIDAPVQMLRTLPFLALVPLFIVWFGIGELTKVALIAFGTVFPIYLTLYSGIRGIDARLIEAGTSFGLSRFELIRTVILPGALPSLLLGLRYSLGIAWLCLVVVEQINATAGIGYLVNSARDFLRTDIIVVCLLVYSLLGFGTDLLVRLVERYALAWRPSFLRA
ncbi:MAG: ABC transporter permease subunit [Solimonas sp.]